MHQLMHCSCVFMYSFQGNWVLTFADHVNFQILYLTLPNIVKLAHIYFAKHMLHQPNESF